MVQGGHHAEQHPIPRAGAKLHIRHHDGRDAKDEDEDLVRVADGGKAVRDGDLWWFTSFSGQVLL